MLGWLFHAEILVQIYPNAAAIQFTTALSFFLLAVAVLLQNFKHELPAKLCVIPVIPMAILALYGNATGSAIITDTLFGDPFIKDKYAIPGRMATLTAIGALFLCVAVWLHTQRARHAALDLGGAIAAAVALAIGGMATLSFLSGLALGGGWASYSGLSPTTAVLLAILSLANLLAAWPSNAGIATRLPKGFVLPVFAGAVASSIVAYATFNSHDAARATEFSELRAIEGLEAVNRRLDVSEDALLRIAQLMAEQRDVLPAEWEATVKESSHDMPGLVTCDIESDGRRARSPISEELDGLSAAAWQVAFPADADLRPQRVGDFRFNGAQYLFMATSAYGSRGHHVRILSVFRPGDFLLAALPSVTAGQFNCELRVKGELIFASTAEPAQSPWIDKPLRNGDGWLLRLQPTNEHMTSRRSEAPMLALGLGFVLAILLTIATQLALVARHRADELDSANVSLSDSRKRLAHLVSALPEAVLTVAPDGTIEDADGAGLGIFGRTKESILGLNVDELIGLDAGANVLRDTKRLRGMEALVGKVIDAEARGPNNATFAATIRVSGFNSADGRRFLWTVLDITWRRQAEAENLRLLAALRQSNEEFQATAREAQENAERFAALLASAPEATILVDVEGSIIEFNKQAEQLLGYSREEAVGKPVEILVPIDFRGRHVDLRAAYSAAPESRRMSRGRDLSAVHKDGDLIPVEVNLSPLRFKGQLLVAASLIDMRERLRAAALIRAKSAEVYDLAQRYANLKNCGAVAVAHTDLNGTILDLNNTLADLVGYTQAELLGTNILKLDHPENSEHCAQLFAELAAGKREYFRDSKRYITKTGGDVWVDVAATLIRDESGVPAYVVGLILDITESVKARIALEVGERRLRIANKELESIVYVASHDMRSPLVNLQGFSRQLITSVNRLQELMKTAPAELQTEIASITTEEIPESIGFISSSTRKMDQLIKGLLRLSRLGRMQLQMRDVNMAQLMDESVRATQFVLTQRGVTVEVGELPRCWGDETQLSQVFSNLLDNAIKYLDPSRPGVIRVYGRNVGALSEYVIEDNGVGIAQQHQTHVFEIFHRLNPNGPVPGEGLGLSVVRRILDRHDGEVRVESEEGKGSKFIVTLPRAPNVRTTTEALHGNPA